MYLKHLQLLAVIFFKIIFHHFHDLALPGGIDDHLPGKLLAVAAAGAIALTADLSAEESVAETVEVAIVDAYVPVGRFAQKLFSPLLKLLFGSVVGVAICIADLLDILAELRLQLLREVRQEGGYRSYLAAQDRESDEI